MEDDNQRGQEAPKPDGTAGPAKKRRKRKGRSQREIQEERRILSNAAILRTMPDDIAGALAKARSKPIWCSEIRWKMELSRRRRRYGY